MDTYIYSSLPKQELKLPVFLRKILGATLVVVLSISSISGQTDICNGDYFIFTAADTVFIDGCRVINGDLYIETNPDLVNTYALRGIEEITGRLQLAFNGALEDVTLASLRKVSEISIFDNYTEFSLNFPALEEADFVEMLFNNMTRIEIPNAYTLGFFDIFDNNKLEAIIMNDQVRIDAVNLFNNTNLDVCCFAYNAALEGRFSGFGNGPNCSSMEGILALDCESEESVVELPVLPKAYLHLLGLIILFFVITLIYLKI